MAEPRRVKRHQQVEEFQPSNTEVSARVSYLLSEQGRRESLRQGGNGRMLQEFDTVVPQPDLDAFAVSEDGVVTLNLAGYFHPFPGDHDFEAPAKKAHWVNGPSSDSEMLQWDIVPSWEDLVAAGRRIKESNELWAAAAEESENQKEQVAKAFLDNPLARASSLERDYVVIDGTRFKIFEAVAIEAKNRHAADHEELKKANRAQLGEWIARHGTDNQRARLAAGLLPWDEAYESAECAFFEPLKRFPRYERFDPANVCKCMDQCEVKFKSLDAAELSAEEWEQFAQIKAAAPDAEFRIREHRAECDSLEEPEIRRAVVVKFNLGSVPFKRQFALTNGEER